MPNLLEKLNTLVKARINNFLDEAGNRISPSRGRLGKNIDGEIAALRRQIDDAISQEDDIQRRVDEMAASVARYDQQIDEALQRGDDPNARLLAQQMQRQEQQANLLRADLEEHRRSTSDLIQQVNLLESMVADAQHQQDQSVESGPALDEQLREAREAVHIPIQIDATQSAPESVQPAPTKIKVQADSPAEAKPTASTAPAEKISPNDAKIDEDLARRRSRLSKPD